MSFFRLCGENNLPKRDLQYVVWKDDNMKTPEWNRNISLISNIKDFMTNYTAIKETLSFPHAKLNELLDKFQMSESILYLFFIHNL